MGGRWRKLGLITKRSILLGVTHSWLRNKFEHPFVILQWVLHVEILICIWWNIKVCDMDNNWVLNLHVFHSWSWNMRLVNSNNSTWKSLRQHANSCQTCVKLIYFYIHSLLHSLDMINWTSNPNVLMPLSCFLFHVQVAISSFLANQVCRP